MSVVDSIPSQPILSCPTIVSSLRIEEAAAPLFVAHSSGLALFIFCKPHPGKQELPTNYFHTCCSESLAELVLPVGRACINAVRIALG